MQPINRSDSLSSAVFSRFFAVSRPLIFTLSAFSLLLFYVFPAAGIDAVTPIASLVRAPVTKSSILRAVTFFEIFNTLCLFCAFFAVLFLSRLAVGKFRISGRTLTALRTLVYGAVGFLLVKKFYIDAGALSFPVFLFAGFSLHKLQEFDEALARGDAALKGWENAALGLIPCAAELLFPRYTMSKTGKVSRAAGFAGVAACVAVFALNGGFSGAGVKAEVAQLGIGNFFGVKAGRQPRQLYACNMDEKTVQVYDLDNPRLPPKKAVIDTGQLQDISLNEDRKEIYHFDRARERLFAYDAGTFAVKRRSDPLAKKLEGSSITAYDNASRTVAVIIEDRPLMIFDMDTFKLKSTVEVGVGGGFLAFNRFTSSYILAFFDNRKSMLSVTADGKRMVRIPAGIHQEGVAVSERFAELYVIKPLRGDIYVYDARTYVFKCRINTMFGARDIAVDDRNGVLVTDSMCNGFVDVIDTATRERLSRIFTGYYLRSIALDTEKRRAYITSYIGGVYALSY